MSDVQEFKEGLNNFIFKFPYLSKHARQSIREYHYSSSDGSIFSRILNPFWEFCAKMLPVSMAPNMVTLLGFIGVILAYGITMLLNWNLDVPVSGWIHVLNASLLFFYQTMDAIDGKHARNIKAGSVLGELFDHGVDAVVTVLMATVVCSAFQLGPTYSACVIVFLLYLTSYLIVWEDYVTDTMRFGLLNGPTEAILFAIAILLLTALVGPNFWTYPIFNVIQLNTLAVITFCVASASAIYDSTSTVLQIVQRPNARFQAIGGMEGAQMSLVSFAGNFVLFVVYALAAPRLVHSHISSFLLTFGLTCAYIQTRMIFARACREKVPSFYFIQLPLPFLVLNATWLHWINVSFTHVLYLGFICAVYTHFAYNCIRELTQVLEIRAFAVKKRTLA